MCMEDIRIGRKAHSVLRIHAMSGGTAELVCPANPSRIALTVGVTGALSAVLGPDDTTTATRGLAVSGATGSRTWTIQETGDWLTRDIWICGSAAGNLAIIETFLADK